MQKGVVRKRRTPPVSEYGRQLHEKQELKKQYNLKERQFARYVEGTLLGRSGGNAEEVLLQRLEKRLDNVVFRMGLAETRKQARQLVSHGHITVNGRKVTIPSHETKRGDVVGARPESKEIPYFVARKLLVKKHEAPLWLRLDKEALSAEVQGVPSAGDIGVTVQVPLVLEFYSR